MRASSADLGWPGAIGLAAAAAGAFTVAFPPLDLWPLVPAAPALLALLALRARSRWVAIVPAVLAHLAMWLWLERWLIGVTRPGYPLLAAYLALYAGAFVVIVRGIGRHPRGAGRPMAVVVPVVWVGLECLRGTVVLNGYPWYLLAHPLVACSPLVQSADLLGTFFVSFLAAGLAGAAVDGWRWRTGHLGPRRAATAIAAAAAVLLLDLGYGWWRPTGTSNARPGPTIVAVQTNLPQDNKISWTREDQVRDVASFLSLTREAYANVDGPVDLLVWPETMLPVRGLEPDTLGRLKTWQQDQEVAFAQDVFDLGRELRTPMLVGCASYRDLDVDAATQRWVWAAHYNSAYLLDGAAVLGRYDKVFLTPFGEVMPYVSAWPWLEDHLLGLGASGMSFTLDAARAPTRLRLPFRGGDLTLAVTICFEDTVARVCRRAVYERGRKRASLIVNLTNDGWFAGHDEGRARHVQIARFRCIENRVPMIRCVNTGHTVSIDADGRVVGTIGTGGYGEARRAGWLAAPVVLDERSSVYGRIGDAWAWFCLLGTALFALGAVYGRRQG